MNEETDFNPPGLTEYIREGARKNAALLRKWQGKPEASQTEQDKGHCAPASGSAIYVLTVAGRSVGWTESFHWAVQWRNQLDQRNFKAVPEIKPHSPNDQAVSDCRRERRSLAVKTPKQPRTNKLKGGAAVRGSALVRRQMEKPYFVMLNNQEGTRLVPMADPENELMMYATKEEAEDAAKHTFYGENFGFEVHESGGVDCCV